MFAAIQKGNREFKEAFARQQGRMQAASREKERQIEVS
jgi:hypothetical protein